MAFGDGLKALAAFRTYKSGDIYLAEDKHVSQNIKAYFDWAIKGKRPVVILQALDNSPQLGEIRIACPLTTGSVKTRFNVLAPPAVIDDPELQQHSVVEVSLLFPIPVSALTKRIGALDPPTLRRVRANTVRMLALHEDPTADES